MAARRRECFTGEVIRKHVSPGSKSEREAVVLRTDVEELVLRRGRGNPFRDEVLEALVGDRITCEGQRRGTTLLLRNWQVIPGDE